MNCPTYCRCASETYRLSPLWTQVPVRPYPNCTPHPTAGPLIYENFPFISALSDDGNVGVLAKEKSYLRLWGYPCLITVDHMPSSLPRRTVVYLHTAQKRSPSSMCLWTAIISGDAKEVRSADLRASKRAIVSKRSTAVSLHHAHTKPRMTPLTQQPRLLKKIVIEYNINQ